MWAEFNQAVSRRALGASLLAAAAIGLAGCAALTPKTPEQVVQERAEQRWAAMIKGDFDTAWTYTQPGYRAVVKQRDYGKGLGAGGRWKGVQIHEVTCEAERCKVRLRLTSEVLTPPFKGQELNGYIDEVWVRDEGQWWFYQSL